MLAVTIEGGPGLNNRVDESLIQNSGRNLLVVKQRTRLLAQSACLGTVNQAQSIVVDRWSLIHPYFCFYPSSQSLMREAADLAKPYS
jgi:hypothetical protein